MLSLRWGGCQPGADRPVIGAGLALKALQASFALRTLVRQQSLSREGHILVRDISHIGLLCDWARDCLTAIHCQIESMSARKCHSLSGFERQVVHTTPQRSRLC